MEFNRMLKKMGDAIESVRKKITPETYVSISLIITVLGFAWLGFNVKSTADQAFIKSKEIECRIDNAYDNGDIIPHKQRAEIDKMKQSIIDNKMDAQEQLIDQRFKNINDKLDDIIVRLEKLNKEIK